MLDREYFQIVFKMGQDSKFNQSEQLVFRIII